MDVIVEISGLELTMHVLVHDGGAPIFLAVGGRFVIPHNCIFVLKVTQTQHHQCLWMQRLCGAMKEPTFGNGMG